MAIYASGPEKEPQEDRPLSSTITLGFRVPGLNHTLPSISSSNHNSFSFSLDSTIDASSLLPWNTTGHVPSPFIFEQVAPVDNKSASLNSQRRLRKANRNTSTAFKNQGTSLNLHITDSNNQLMTTFFNSARSENYQEQTVSEDHVKAGWSLMPSEVKQHILSFLKESNESSAIEPAYFQERQAVVLRRRGRIGNLDSRTPATRIVAEGRKFLTYRLVSREFNNLLQSIPCSLTLHYINVSPEHLDHLQGLFNFNLKGLVLNNFQDNSFIFDHLRTQLLSLKMLDLRGSPNLNVNMLYYISKILSLEELSLEGPQINDQAITYIKNLTNLKVLALRNTNIQQQILAVLKSNSTLEAIDLSKAQKTGHTYINQDLAHVSHFPSLTKLNISGHPITDKALQYLHHLSSLKALLLSDTDITDQGLDYIGELSLEHLNLSRTRITIVGFQQRVTRNMFSKLKILTLDQIQMSHIGLSSLIMPLEKLEEIYLRNSGVHITHILQYYENISGIKQKDLIGYNMIMLPNNSIKEESSFFEKVRGLKEPKDIFGQEIPLSHELIKAFYEQRITGVKIFI